MRVYKYFGILSVAHDDHFFFVTIKGMAALGFWRICSEIKFLDKAAYYLKNIFITGNRPKTKTIENIH